MNIFKNQTLIGVVVGIMVLGVAMTYVPLLFTPQTPNAPATANNLPASDETASLPAAVNASTTATSTTSTPSTTNEPSGFSGLDNELNNLNNLSK